MCVGSLVGSLIGHTRMRQRQVERSRSASTNRTLSPGNPEANEPHRESRAIAWLGGLRRSSECSCSTARPRRMRLHGGALLAAVLPRAGSAVLQTFPVLFV